MATVLRKEPFLKWSPVANGSVAEIVRRYKVARFSCVCHTERRQKGVSLGNSESKSLSLNREKSNVVDQLQLNLRLFRIGHYKAYLFTQLVTKEIMEMYMEKPPRGSPFYRD